MPPKRGQNYTERVNKRRRAADSSATTDSGVQPHPSRLQPVQLQEPSNAARATPQLTLSAEVLAALTNSISAAVSEALLTVAQPLQPAATAAATAFPVAHPSTSAAAAAVPEVQFVPDPISISSAEVVNRGSSVVEANPTTPNADQLVLNTVNNAVQQVTSSLLPGAAPQSEAIRCNYCESYVSFEDCDKRLKRVECAKEFALDHCMKTHIKASSRTEEKFKRGCQSARKCNKPPCKAPGDDKCDVFCCTEDNCNKSSTTVDGGATSFICAMLATILIRLTE